MQLKVVQIIPGSPFPQTMEESSEVLRLQKMLLSSVAAMGRIRASASSLDQRAAEHERLTQQNRPPEQSWIRFRMLQPSSGKKADTKSELKLSGSMTKKYIIHMCTKTCTADTDSRILRFADTHSRCGTEGQPEFQALHRSGRLFDDFLLDDANISVVAGGFPIRRGAVRLCGVVKSNDHVPMDF